MAKQLACNLRRIIILYSRAGFVIQTILMDMDFNKVAPELPKVIINMSAASEHVAEVGRTIRVVKKMQGIYVSNAIQNITKHHDDKFSSLLCILVKYIAD